MSADNYLYVRPVGKQWTFTHEFASDEHPRRVRASDPRYGTEDDAFAAALAWEKDDGMGGTEYGIIVGRRELADLREEKAADQQAVRDVIKRPELRMEERP